MKLSLFIVLPVMIFLAAFIGIKLRALSDEIGHVPDELDELAENDDAKY